MLFPATFVLAGLVFLLAIGKIWRKNGQSNRLPPGSPADSIIDHAPSGRLPPSPPADPFIWHARKLPRGGKSWETYAEWGRSYGDVISAYALGRTMIIVNSFAAAHDLLDKKSLVFSGRPWMPILELMGWAGHTFLLPYGERLRNQRRMMQKYFSAQAIPSFRSLQEAEVHRFLRHLLVRPNKFSDDIQGLVAGITLSATYGHRVLSEGDPLVELIDHTNTMGAGLGDLGTTSLDIFPILRHVPAWIPGMGVKRLALEVCKFTEQVQSRPYNELKLKRAEGKEVPCLISYLLDDYEEAGAVDSEHEEDIKAVGAVIYSAGNDTTKTVISTFFLLMTLHPNVATRAQEEIDRVVGADRLPTFDDWPNLPYIDCILKELYRINPPIPLGLPHLSSEKDTYRGWLIPKGSIVIANMWPMMRDEKVFSNPDLFDPEKHAFVSNKRAASHKDDETSEEHANASSDPSAIVFGFGRRVCPGRNFADAIIWLTMVSVLATFDIRPVRDPDSGKDVPPDLAFESRNITTPKPFSCAITPRSVKHAQLINGDTH
ncbi:cytochrome P450 [Phellopilus nigrolimitatus]|nr:cytochrome P450 [Phellopilus nigrolimitatus]